MYIKTHIHITIILYYIVFLTIAFRFTFAAPTFYKNRYLFVCFLFHVFTVLGPEDRPRERRPWACPWPRRPRTWAISWRNTVWKTETTSPEFTKMDICKVILYYNVLYFTVKQKKNARSVVRCRVRGRKTRVLKTDRRLKKLILYVNYVKFTVNFSFVSRSLSWSDAL